ncbi:MAG: hypothetical protein PHU53_01460, partial [Thermoplasmata archaeon]|nr:hypothetical protein [Thermoplasmata archaeon]
RGAGAIIRTSPAEAVKSDEGEDFGSVFDEAIKTAEFIKAPESVITKLKKMKETWTYNYSPEEVLQVIFDSYGLK